jgi:hypothetical protein
MGTVDQEIQKILMAIRHKGSEMTLSIPPSKLKGEAIKLRDRCNELIERLGGEGE